MTHSLKIHDTPNGMGQALGAILYGEYGWFGCRIVEPCCGNGSLVRQFAESRPAKIWTNDINKNVQSDMHMDAHDPAFWEWTKLHFGQIGWIITNPSFSIAETLLPIFLRNCPRVAVLLRVSWLEPTKQRGFMLHERPPSRIISFGLPRPSFEHGKHDNVTTAWWVWNCDDPWYQQKLTKLDWVTRWKR